IEEYDSTVPEEVPGLKEALRNKDTTAATAAIKEYLLQQNKIPLNIGIIGESGSGKSTFINALRNKCDDEEGAAATDVVETTSIGLPYPYPNSPNVILWDLRGIGTTKSPAKKYLKLVEFQKFDFFIIISDTRFRENDVKLAAEIQKRKKKFYFVRSKIDNDIRAEERKRDFSEKETLTKIREDCVQKLRELGIKSPQVFLVSSFDLHLYDFSLLHKTLEGELPSNKRDTLLFVMPSINPEIINRKKKAFKRKIYLFATLSGAAAGVPVPGLSIAVDIVVLAGAVTYFVHGFGLDIPSLKRLCDRTGMSYTDLCKDIKSELAAAEITHKLLLKVLTQIAGTAALIGAEEICRFIPIIGIPLSMGLSFTTTYRLLDFILQQLAEDAHMVFNKAIQLHI
uniref:IRG-type G domain-containing protein n=1 Tax=Amphilophus citrinellus TaxID=61819 RepID=A0A3Q0S7T3_AMPCI